MNHLSPLIYRDTVLNTPNRHRSYNKVRTKQVKDSIEDLKTFVPDWLTSNKEFIASYKKMKHQVDINLAEVCQKSYISRSSDEKKALFQWTKSKSYFSDVSKEIVKRVCDKFSCMNYKAGETSKIYLVINEGDEPNWMYMIYEGTVGIYIKGQKVNHRASGEPLGENALVNESLRTADAIAETNVTVFKLKRADYEGIILTLKKKEKKTYSALLKSMPIFSSWKDVKIMMLAHVIIVSNYVKGEVIYEPEDPSHSFYIIKEGNVQIQTEIKILEENKWPVSPREWNIRKVTKRIYYPIQSLYKLDYFGQIELIDKELRQTRAVAITDSVCFVINRNYFEEVFNTKDKDLLKNTFKIPSKEDIETIIKKSHSSMLEREKILLDAVYQNKNGNFKEKKIEKWIKFVKERITKEKKDMKKTIVKHTLENVRFTKH
jgi:signal-transduction protein with cAMP-binding, CBS, and nucleotidyltransferase domain